MEPKKNPKANLSRWSPVYLLAGLVLMLFISWQAIEYKTFEKSDIAGDLLDVGDDLLEDVPITQQLTPPPPPPPPPPAPEVIEVVEDEEEVEETIIESTETNQNEEIVEIEEIEEVVEEEIADVPFAVIENVPIYPGCENAGNNNAKKKCMSDKVNAFINKKFNKELASELGLEPGIMRINVQFKIDRSGKVVDVRARAPHPRLEKEAISVVGSLPKMTPGKQRGKAVGVLYGVPIIFQVE